MVSPAHASQQEKSHKVVPPIIIRQGEEEVKFNNNIKQWLEYKIDYETLINTYPEYNESVLKRLIRLISEWIP